MIDTRELPEVKTNQGDPPAYLRAEVSDESSYLPGADERLIDRYVYRAMLRAAVKQYEDGTWFAEILGVPNVWARDTSLEQTLGELESVLRAWIEDKLEDEDGDIPVIDSIDLNVL